MKFTAEHTPGGLIIRDQNGKFIAMSYAPTTQEEKDTLELILNAPVMKEALHFYVKNEDGGDTAIKVLGLNIN